MCRVVLTGLRVRVTSNQVCVLLKWVYEGGEDRDEDNPFRDGHRPREGKICPEAEQEEPTTASQKGRASQILAARFLPSSAAT
jgi:hypothetical protein